MKLTIRVDSAEAQEFLKQLAPTVLKAIESGFRDFMNRVANRVREKLSGEVLKVRSGRLRQSIFTPKIDKTPTGFIGSIGSNVKYAAIHEFGGIIHIPEIFPKNKLALHFFIGGKEIFAKRVKAHTITMPERSYLRTSIAELEPQAPEIILSYIEDSLKGT